MARANCQPRADRLLLTGREIVPTGFGRRGPAASRPFVAGLHVCNFAEFKTGQGILRAAGLDHNGVFTRDRRPKMAAHFLRSRRRRE